MSKMSAASLHIISVIAHAAMARGMSKNVDGFAGFYEFWLKEQSEKDRKILDEFQRESIRANKDFTAMLARDIKNG